MKYVWLVLGLMIGFVLGGFFGPNVGAYWEEREMRAANDVLSETVGLLAEPDALSEQRATLLNERVELAQELTAYSSYEALAADRSGFGQLERLFTIEHEMIELDERQRWLHTERAALEELEQRLNAHVDGSNPLPESELSAVRATLDAAPRATSPLPSDKVLRRLFESLGGA